jgi:transposase-like protein
MAEKKNKLAKTVQQLADEYGISCTTMRRWLKKIEQHTGPRIGYIYNPRQVKIIYERLGEP